jgi:Flp pilus assembly protein TadG
MGYASIERHQERRHESKDKRFRKGIVAILALLILPVVFAFVALSVDTGLINCTQVDLQNAADAAALAASQEITSAIHQAGQGEGDATIDANSIAVAAAREMAYMVAQANGAYIDPDHDVHFGKRVYDEQTGTWPIEWDSQPYNVVRVEAHMDNPDMNAPDHELRLMFGTFVGHPTVPLSASASAFVEARDLVVVLDFSGSMNDDSEFRKIYSLDQADIEANMLDIFNALGPPDVGDLPFDPEYLTIVGQPPADDSQPQIEVTFKYQEIFVESTKDLSNVVLQFTNGYTQRFEDISGLTGTFAGTDWYAGMSISHCWIKSGSNDSGDGPGYGELFDDTNTAVKEAFGLDSVDYPYPSGTWDTFIDHCRRDSDVRNAGYPQMYGGKNFVDYLLNSKPRNDQTPDLWKTPQYPFHAIKNGCTLFCDFLTELDFGDELGLVSYDSNSRVESFLDDGEAYVDITSNPITTDYAAIDTIQRHKQAGHYNVYTGMGYGVLEAADLLDAEARYGARPTILLMTDGLANQYPSGWSMPGDFDWADWTHFDDDGVADYTTGDTSKQYAFWQVSEAISRGYTVHTMSVGTGADRNLMEAIAVASGGEWIDVPGGSTVAEMESQLLAAFGRIASQVPPAKLVYDDGTGEP